MTGDGILKTIMDTITVLTVWEVHGTGADIIVHTGAHGATVHTGDGDITDITTLGIITHTITDPAGTMAQVGTARIIMADGMTRGIMEVSMDGTTHGTMVDTMAGMTCGHTTYITAGTTHTITIMAQAI